MQQLELPERFANLIFNGLQLLIPQNDIFSLEPSVDIEATSEVSSIGSISQNNQKWLLYALSSELNVLNYRPDNYHIVILMKNVQPAYGLLCEQATTLLRNDITIQPIPAAMHYKNSPLLALALYGQQVYYVSSATALARLFGD